MFSVDTEADAKTLLIMSCPRGEDGHFYARELIEEQSLENLQLFSDKLARNYEHLLESRKAKR